MAGAKNRKLCWNCEGSVHVHATKCPYCGTDLSAEAPVASYNSAPTSIPSEPREVVPPPPLPPHQSQYFAPPPIPEIKPMVQQGEKPQKGILPILLLLPGAFFLFFGLILLLFSNDGMLSLEWNAHYWFFYLLVALPLIYYGWKMLGRRSPEPVPEPIRNQEPLPPPPPFDPYAR